MRPPAVMALADGARRTVGVEGDYCPGAVCSGPSVELAEPEHDLAVAGLDVSADGFRWGRGARPDSVRRVAVAAEFLHDEATIRLPRERDERPRADRDVAEQAALLSQRRLRVA